ncbi:MAG TPA: hypothetical protein VKA15_07845 [Isosphaeraceae bacterium]|nr:hypothetical protein [Isosphaeraceae bacterium]
MKERFRWLAAAIAAHKDRTVVGRTRLQKEIKLLQRLGFPTEYTYTIFFYGPYSEGLNADVRLLESLGLVTERKRRTRNDDTDYYIYQASPEAVIPEISQYEKPISVMEQADAVVLELAATYDAFRAMGSHHQDALNRLRRKKGTKCDDGNVAKALDLLRRLSLPTT